MSNIRRLVFWLVVVGLGIAACDSDQLHPQDEETEERSPPVAPSEEAQQEVREEERRETLPDDGE